MSRKFIAGSLLAVAPAFLVALLAGCSPNMRAGHPTEAEVVRPDRITDFDHLYSQNCSGCHGADGSNGIAIALNNPEYWAVADDASVRNVTAQGLGTLMPGFGKGAGGLLTSQQIDAIVSGMRQRWARPGALSGQNPPPYKADAAGDAAHGQQAYATYCASCHGNAQQTGKAGSILDGSFLALIDDQTLRSIVIAGRPDLGQPDWRGDVQGHPMSAQDVTDVVAWLSSQRPANPGQPYTSQLQPILPAENVK